MKKSIDEIVNNKNYIKLNEALRDRSVEIAEIVRNEMRKLNIIEIGDYKIIEVKSRSGFHYEYLGMITENGYDYEYVSLENRDSYYYTGDFNCWIEAARTQDRIQFLNATKEIFEKIDEIKENRCEKIKTVLEETSNIDGQ